MAKPKIEIAFYLIPRKDITSLEICVYGIHAIYRTPETPGGSIIFQNKLLETISELLTISKQGNPDHLLLADGLLLVLEVY